MTDQERYERQATRIVEQYKANMKYYRVLGVREGLVLLEQVHTRQQITMPIEEVIGMCKEFTSYFALSNPSELAKFVSDKDVFYYWNSQKVYTLLDPEEGDFNDISDINLTIQVKERGTNSVAVSKLLAGKLDNYRIITNIEKLKESLLKVLPLLDRLHVGETIISSLHDTFAYIFEVGEIQSNNAGKYKFTVREKKGSETADTTLFFTLTKNALKITGKRNNYKLEQTYNFSSFRSYDLTYVIKICAKIFYDVCNALGFNPERFYLSPRSIHNSIKSDKYSLKITSYNVTDQKFGGCNLAFKVKFEDIIFDGFAALEYKMDKLTLGKSFRDFCNIACDIEDLYTLKGKCKLVCKDAKVEQTKSFDDFKALSSAIDAICDRIYDIKHDTESYKGKLEKILIYNFRFKRAGKNSYYYDKYKNQGFVCNVTIKDDSYVLSYEKSPNKEVVTNEFKFDKKMDSELTSKCWHLEPLRTLLENLRHYYDC